MKKNLDVRLPIGAGRFYPSDKGELTFTIEEALSTAEQIIEEGTNVKALIVPGLAFEYALDTLAIAYKQIENSQIDEVFLFADPILHKQDNMSFSSARSWETPLGRVEASHRINMIVHDDDNLKDLMVFDDQKHEGESLLEMQLSFMQYLFDDTIRIIPFMTHDVSPRISSSSLENHIDSDDLLIAVSHLSGGLPKEYAIDVDTITRDAILNKDVDTLQSDSVELSSRSSVSMLVEIAKTRNWKVKELSYSQVEKRRGEDMTIGIVSYIFFE